MEIELGLGLKLTYKYGNSTKKIEFTFIPQTRSTKVSSFLVFIYCKFALNLNHLFGKNT